MTFNSALKTFTDAGSANINFLTFAENCIYFEIITGFEIVDII